MALVITLAMLVMVSLLVVAFVTAMRLDRSATASYSQSLKAEMLARGAMQLVVSELQQEMAKDAPSDSTYAGEPLYTNVMWVKSTLGGIPSTTNIEPQRVGALSSMANLIKISTNSAPFTGTVSSGKLLASTINSATPSFNGRSVSAARWNQAYMGTFPSDKVSTPYWVLMTRAGATNGTGLPFGPTTANSVNNPTLTNPNYVVGRVAYAIYDEGGLLNINVAGYPSTTSSAAVSKGAPVWADLSLIPGISDPDSLVKWRNAASSSSSSTFTSYVTNYASTNGFSTVYPGDMTFLSRSDLIQYALANSGVIGTNALPYLTTFSWEQNTPCWKPVAITSGSPAYANLANTLSSTNVFFPLARVTTGGWTRRNGATAVKGEPLLLQRFPLDKIALLNATTAPAVVDKTSDIYKYFGLTRTSASSPWVYSNESSAGAINTLKQVSQLGGANAREPDFFEIVNACLLTGSVGQSLTGNTDLASAVSWTPNGSGGSPGQDTMKILQVMQIAANIIDQATADNYPTIISFTNGTMPMQVAGVKDLPYPHTFLFKSLTYNPKLGSNPYPDTPAMQSWFQTNFPVELYFSMWNPHQLIPANSSLPGPTNFQIMADNMAGTNCLISMATWGNEFYTPNSGLGIDYHAIDPLGDYTRSYNLTNTPIPFSVPNANDGGADYRSSPRVIRTDGTQAATNVLDFPNGGAVKAIGYKLMGHGIYYYDGMGTNAAAQLVAENAEVYQAIDIQRAGFAFQFKDPSGAYQTYARIGGQTNMITTNGIFNANNWGYLQSPSPEGSTTPSDYEPNTRPDNTDGIGYLKSDPRTERFGYSYSDLCYVGGSGSTWMTSKGDNPLIASATTTTTYFNYSTQNNPNGASSPCRLDLYSQNTTSLASGYYYNTYNDPDGTTRPGDSYLASTNQPMSSIPAQAANRPIILSRPFRSVGELGYTYRDAPWKTIDFSSTVSADGGLLDAFTVTDAALIAGKVDLNTRHPEVLQALISGANYQEVSQTTLPQSSTPTTPGTNNVTDAGTFATSIVNTTGTLPLANVGQLPGLLPNANKNLASPLISKIQLESVTRALADTTTTRTWNLMIDIVAQSGEYPPAATGLDQFTVEGERHMWMHVAIDRFTGQVIAKQIEVPND